MRRFQALKLASLPFLLAAGTSALAQISPTAPANTNEVDFEADTLEYDDKADVVTASGNVEMVREGNRVRADKIIWQRKTGEVVATGNVKVVNPGGDIAYGDRVELTDTLKEGIVQNLLIVLANGGRLAAREGSRTSDQISVLDNAAYSPCAIADADDCPAEPSWKITARKIVYNPTSNRIRFQGARLELFGLPLPILPAFSVPSDNTGATGVLVPNLNYSRTNGLELSAPLYLRIDKNRDLTVTPRLFTDALPAISANYRALTSKGAYQIGGFATYGSRIPLGSGTSNSERDFRGYLDANARFQLEPKLTLKASTRLVTDRTLLRRYDISRDDRLRTIVNLERTSRSSYFSIAAYGFQTLRTGDRQGQVPIALPLIDYRKRFTDPLVGGRFELQLNTLAVSRTNGQDTQRGFASARWDLRGVTGLGQEVILTGLARGDVYHTDESALTQTIIYRGEDGVRGRFISAAAAEVRWPFIGNFFTGTQRLTPRVQVVAAPRTRNSRLPNEDSRSIDLEDTNLFTLNRFPGYDRFEDGTRVTYGVDWAIDLKDFSLQSNIGQSYRLSTKATIFPDGTGLTNRTSDIVGRTTLKYKRFVTLTHRYRLDKDGLAIRRNEIDTTIGSDTTYATIGYLRLNRDVALGIEDLRDRQEARVGARAQFARYWSIFGSAIIDLTGPREDPTSTSDGFDPVRTRLGIAYEDDCLKLGFTWRRDFDATGDARRGNSYQLELSFRNLGR